MIKYLRTERIPSEMDEDRNNKEDGIGTTSKAGKARQLYGRNNRL